MRRVFLVIVFLLVVCSKTTYAMISVISEPVTSRAVSAQGTWAVCNGSSLICPDLPSSLFRANQSDDGLANEFVLDDTYILKSVSGWYIPDYIEEPYIPNFDIRLYQGTKESTGTPLNLLATWNVQVPRPPKEGVNPLRDFKEGDLYTVKDLDVVLEPGKYWIAAQAGGDGRLFPGEASAITTPEPATMLLMGGGLIGLFHRRRRR